MPADLEAAREWYSVHIRPRRRRNGAAGPAPVSPAPAAAELPIRSWRDRQERAAALLREQELARALGRSLDSDVVETVWASRIAGWRQRLLAIPSKAAARMPAGLQAKVLMILTELIREVLLELAGSPRGENGHDDKG